MKKSLSKLNRPRYPMPDFVLQALKKHGLLDAYNNRPPYQQNDYIGWITRAAQETTKQKRLNQMLDELKRGDAYMGMNYKSKKSAIKNPAIAKDVDEYIASVSKGARAVLENLRQAIKSAAPKAEEVISYRIPTYKYHGQLVFFVAHKNHCSLVVISKAVLQKFEKELEDFEISGTTIHFSAEHPLPAALVKKIVQARIEENEKQAP